MIRVLAEVERRRLPAVRADELHAVLPHGERRRVERLDEAQALQRVPAPGNERLADAVAREVLSLEEEHAPSGLAEDGRRRSAGGTAADDDRFR